MVFVLMLAVFGVARLEAGYGVSDGAHFFSEYARGESVKILEQISDTLRQDVYVETFERVPEEVLRESKGLDLKNPAQASRLYEGWAARQAVKKRVNGVYMLLVRQPAHLHVVVGKETRKGVFGGADRDQLVKLMLGRLREKRYDEALLEGTGFVSAVMHANAPGGHAAGRAAALDARQGGDLRKGGFLDRFGGVWGILGGAFVIWVLFRMLGGLLGGGGMGGAGGMASGSGGGFFRSMLGGLFGAAAGMWMYDQFFGQHGQASDFGGAGAGSDFDSGRDYEGSGGDFGSEGSGDSGGFDGGDFGGGDSGGGGDFGGD